MPGNSFRGLTVHVIGGNRLVEQCFIREGAKVRGMETADILVFTGGVDISTDIYDEPMHPRTQNPDKLRDRMEIAVFKASSKNQWKIGICRGGQLLHCLNGGALWQHVDRHLGPHEIRYVDETGHATNYLCSSTHHQMMNLKGSPDALVWGWANQTETREFPDGKSFEMGKYHWKDPEIVYHKDTLSLCFQPHPEYTMPNSTKALFNRVVNRAVEL